MCVRRCSGKVGTFKLHSFHPIFSAQRVEFAGNSCMVMFWVSCELLQFAAARRTASPDISCRSRIHTQWTVQDGYRTVFLYRRHMDTSHVIDGEPETVDSVSLQRRKWIKNRLKRFSSSSSSSSSFSLSPWYNRNGWLDVKHQVTLSLSLPPSLPPTLSLSTKSETSD